MMVRLMVELRIPARRWRWEEWERLILSPTLGGRRWVRGRRREGRGKRGNAQVDVDVGTLDRLCEFRTQRGGIDGVEAGGAVGRGVRDVDPSWRSDCEEPLPTSP